MKENYKRECKQVEFGGLLLDVWFTRTKEFPATRFSPAEGGEPIIEWVELNGENVTETFEDNSELKRLLE